MNWGHFQKARNFILFMAKCQCTTSFKHSHDICIFPVLFYIIVSTEFPREKSVYVSIFLLPEQSFYKWIFKMHFAYMKKPLSRITLLLMIILPSPYFASSSIKTQFIQNNFQPKDKNLCKSSHLLIYSIKLSVSSCNWLAKKGYLVLSKSLCKNQQLPLTLSGQQSKGFKEVSSVRQP